MTEDKTPEAQTAQEAQEPAAAPSGPDAQKDQETRERIDKDLTKIRRAFGIISAAVYFLRDPLEAIARYGTENQTLQYMEHSLRRIAGKIAEKTGGQIEDIINPKTRTQEQQDMILKLGAEEEMACLDRYFECNYARALYEIADLKGKYQQPEGEDSGIYEYTVLYFFVLHCNRNATAPDDLTEENLAELRDTFYRIDEYLYQHGATKETESSLFIDFIQADNKELDKPETRPTPPDLEVRATDEPLDDTEPEAERENQAEPIEEEPEVIEEREPTRWGPSRAFKAEKSGALTTIGERLFVPTDPEYQDAFMTSLGHNIGFYRLADDGKKQLALDVNPEFIRALGRAVFIDALNGGKDAVSVYFPKFLRELGIVINQKTDETAKGIEASNASRSAARAEYLYSVMYSLTSLWGTLPGDATEYPLVSVQSYNPETEVLSFVSPYLWALVGALTGKERGLLDRGKKYYLWNCELLHATAASERNHAAVEMATRILVGVQKRGLTPDGKLKKRGKHIKDDKLVTYTINCAGLVSDCSQIREKLKLQESASRKTQELRRSFTIMYKVLREKTDLFDYYTDLSITERIPTWKTLVNTDIVITHHGSNPQYKAQPLPIRWESEPETETPEEETTEGTEAE